MKNRNLRCIVEDCFGREEQDSRSMFKFPTNPVIRLQWIENIGLSKDANLCNRRVCRRHFESNCFGKAKLFSWAVPTLFLGKNEVLHIGIPKKKSLYRKCSLRNCSTRSPPERLYFFPSDPQMREKWLNRCNLKGNQKWLYICGRHFRRSKLPNGNSKLRKDAIPELYLGLENEDPLENCLIENPRRKKSFRSEAEDEGIDEENSKGSQSIQQSCSNCLNLKDQLAAALLRIQQLEQKQQDHADTDEDEYIYMIMK
ncbi:hypothetical protein KR009_010038 [Drosophila setifemur]|nr:hypothetical protein KR009_010038 [Drosophila setifemur]